MTLDTPFWVKQRQVRIEESGQGTWKVGGPNLPDAVLSVRIGPNLRWQAALQDKSGAEQAFTVHEFATIKEAVSAAFELYRNHIIQ